MSTLDVVDKQKTESSPSRTNICSETFLGEGNIPIDLLITPEVPKQLLIGKRESTAKRRIIFT